MRNKIINHLLLFANVLFILGIVITTIIINKINVGTFLDSLAVDDRNKILKSFLPFIFCMILSLVSAGFFGHFRKEYFILIKQHITKKTENLYKASVFMLFFNILLAIIMLFSSILIWNTDNINDFYFFKNVYLYILLGIEMFLTLIDVCIDSIAKLKIKVDLAYKRTGVSEFLDGDKNE